MEANAIAAERRITSIEARLDRVERELSDLQVTATAAIAEHVEFKLMDRELKTNWRLAVALGGFVATLLIGIMLFIATSAPSP